MYFLLALLVARKDCPAMLHIVEVEAHATVLFSELEVGFAAIMVSSRGTINRGRDKNRSRPLLGLQ